MALPDTPVTPLIPLDSTEVIWEWHIPTDLFFLSKGACTALNFGEAAPQTMQMFASAIPPACLPHLRELREGALDGTTGSLLELAYPFGTLFVREHMIVLERNGKGRAVRAIGHYIVSGTQAYHPPVTNDPSARVNAEIGYWHCSLARKQIKLDHRCCTMLGYTDGQARTLPLREWKERLHPEEGTACRFQLIFEDVQWGDTLEDTVRVRTQSGEYASLLTHGAVVERDDAGHALTLAGSMQRADISGVGTSQPIENGRLLFAINAAGDGLWDWDAQTDSVYYSPRYLSMLGYTAEEFPGDLEVWKQKIHPDDRHKIVQPQRDIVESPRYGDTFECTYRIQRADNTWAWILGRGYVTHRDATGRATRLVGLHTDITATQNGREQLEDLVKNDALTGLRSRSFFDMELARIEKLQIRPLSVISCDVNGLKLINDYMGHSAGDTLLRKAALMLRHCLRATDCVARMGGDEFVILLPGCAPAKADEILAQLKQHFQEQNTDSDEMPTLVAFGVAGTSSEDVPLSRLLMESDRNMLRNKDRHRLTSHRQIKDWIEKNKAVSVSIEDARYES